MFLFFFVAFSGQLENAIWGPATCCMHIQLCHARCHVNFIYHDHAHARPNKTNAARKVEIIVKKTRTRRSSAKSCTNRNEIIEFSFPFYVFTSAASCRQRQRRKVAHFTLLSCSPQSQLKQAYLPSPPLSLFTLLLAWATQHSFSFRPICIQKHSILGRLEKLFKSIVKKFLTYFQPP